MRRPPARRPVRRRRRRRRSRGRDERRGALAVRGLLAGEVPGDRLDRGAERAAPPRIRRSTGAAPGPEASTNTVSLVLVSPSTESWSQVRRRGRPEQAQSAAGAAVASVRTTESIVAIRGWIIPTPLAMPRDRHGHAARRPRLGQLDAVVVAAFVRESVVRSASAAAASPSSVPASVAASSRARPAPDAVEREPGADDPGREVEGQRPRRSRPRRQRRSGRSRAGRRRRRHRSRRWRSRWSRSAPSPSRTRRADRRTSPRGARRDRRTGAAANAFGVNTAAAAAGPPVVTDDGEVRPAGGLDPGRRPPARNPAGMAGRRSTGGRTVGDPGG